MNASLACGIAVAAPPVIIAPLAVVMLPRIVAVCTCLILADQYSQFVPGNNNRSGWNRYVTLCTEHNILARGTVVSAAVAPSVILPPLITMVSPVVLLNLRRFERCWYRCEEPRCLLRSRYHRTERSAGLTEFQARQHQRCLVIVLEICSCGRCQSYRATGRNS